MKFAPLVLLVACTSAPTTEPTIEPNAGPWFVNEPTNVGIEWPQDVQCNSNSWSCDSGPVVEFNIDNVTCAGCTTTGIQVGQEVTTSIDFTLVASTTDAITLEVDVSAAGVSRHLVATATGDRELGLVAHCQLLWPEQVGETQLDGRDCGTSRAAGEDVMIDWHIATVHGERLVWDAEDTSQISPAPQMWWGHVTPVYTSLGAPSVTMTLPLGDGSLSTATIAIPPVQ